MFGVFRRLKEAKEVYQHAETVQAELRDEFAAMGMNFMQLHHTVHKALLREAMATNVTSTVKNFAEFVHLVSLEDGSDDEKAQMLIDSYCERERKVDEAIS